MSNTRQEGHSSQAIQIITAGIIGGIAKSSILYIPHKFSFYINTAEHKATWTEAAQSFRGQSVKFFYGLDAAIFYSSINYMVFFGAQMNLRDTLIEKYPQINAGNLNSAAATAASIFTTFAVSPLALWKQKRMLTCASHKQTWNEFWMPPISKSWRGAAAKVMSDAINTGVIYMTLDFLNQADRCFRSTFNYSIITATTGGAIAGFVGSLASNPFAVIVNKQRETYESFLKTMTRIYQTKGIYGFYPKFLGISAINGICGGVIFNHLKCYLDKTFSNNANNILPTSPAVSELSNEIKIIPSSQRNIEHDFNSLSKKKSSKIGLFHSSNNSAISLLEGPEAGIEAAAAVKKSA